jgi:hypothetical protein
MSFIAGGECNNENAKHWLKKAFKLAAILWLVNLIISVGLVLLDFKLDLTEQFQIIPTSSPGFSTFGVLWFTVMVSGWIIFILSPLGTTFFTIEATVPGLETNIKAALTDLTLINLCRFRLLLIIGLGWTSGAALSVIFLSTIGRAEYGYYPLLVMPLLCRSAMSFGAAIGVWSTQILGLILGTIVGYKYGKTWKSLILTFPLLIVILAIIFVGSNEALVYGVCGDLTAISLALAVFTTVGPIALSCSLILFNRSN